MRKINTVYINPTNNHSRVEINKLFSETPIKFSNVEMPLSGAPRSLMNVVKIGLDGLKLITSKARELGLSYEIHRRTEDEPSLAYFVDVCERTGIDTPFIIKNAIPRSGRYTSKRDHLVATLKESDAKSPLVVVARANRGLQPLHPEPA